MADASQSDSGRTGALDEVPGSRRVWAAVPFKGPVGSKRRLSALLSEAERASLSLAMLDGVLDALLGVPAVERVLVLGPRGSLAGAREDGRVTVVDEIVGEEGLAARDNLNATVRQAQSLAEVGGADALLVVPADLPLVTTSDVVAILDAGTLAPVAIAPDRAGGGTNALLMTPPTALTPRFGEASFERHRGLARRAGLALVVVERSGLALDLDTPADVELLMASGQECRAARLLHELQIGERLGQVAATQARSTTI